MPTIITSGSSTITPTMVLGYSATRESQTVVHPVLGSSNPDIALRPAMLRSGTLELGFAGPSSESTAKTAYDLLSTAALFNLVSTDRTTVPMPFVVTGSITLTLDDETRDAWVLGFDWQEVTP